MRRLVPAKDEWNLVSFSVEREKRSPLRFIRCSKPLMDAIQIIVHRK